MRVLVCGDRNWEDYDIIEHIVASLPHDAIIVHGCAPGADSLGGKAARHWNLKVEEFPAQWDKFGRAAGPKRNQQMLDSGLDLAFAFHDDLLASKGTADMVKRLRKAKVKTYVVGRAY